MSYWYCRECRTVYREAQLLPGWDGWWCANCIWSDVEEILPTAPTPRPPTNRRRSLARRSLTPSSRRLSLTISPRRTRRG